MAGLTKDRNTDKRDGTTISLGVAAGKKIFAGALVSRNAQGYATPGEAVSTHLGAGRAEAFADNSTGADAAVSVLISKGVFRYGNSSGADEVTGADLGADCFAVDDQTVAKTSGGGTRPVAGRVFDVDSDGVWVRFE